MTINVRPLEIDDHAAWLPLWRGYQSFYEVDLPPEVTAATWQRIHDAREPVHGLAALDNGALVGFAHFLYHRSTWRVADTCYLQDLFVVRERRGHGIARALVENVYFAADATGVGQVYWLTHENNSAARRLYDQIATFDGFIAYERFVEAAPAPVTSIESL